MECCGVPTGVETDREPAVSSRRSITMGTMMTALDEGVRRRGAVSGLALGQATTQNRWPRRVCLAFTAFHPPPVVLAALLTAALVARLQDWKLTRLA
jgi:hypothetical protein